MTQRASKLNLDDICDDAGTQARARIEQEVVDDYAGAMHRHDVFPPVVVFYDGTRYFLASGFHRVAAARQNGARTIAAIVERGTAHDALWFGLGANKANGHRMSRPDKAAAVKRAIGLKPDLSNAQIAKHVGVDDHTVARYRSGNAESESSENSERDLGIPSLVTIPNRAQPARAQGTSGRETVRVEPVDDDVPMDGVDGDGGGDVGPSAEISAGGVDTLGRAFCGDQAANMAEDFARRGEITGLLRAISQVKQRVNRGVEENDRLFLALNHSRFVAEIEGVYRQLRAIAPHAVCPYCGGDGCRACNENGWVGEFVYSQAPDEMRTGRA